MHDFYSTYGLQLAVRLWIRRLLFRGHQYTLVYRGFRGHTPSFIAARGWTDYAQFTLFSIYTPTSLARRVFWSDSVVISCPWSHCSLYNWLKKRCRVKKDLHLHEQLVIMKSFVERTLNSLFLSTYSQLSPRRTPLGPTPSVRFREMSVL